MATPSDSYTALDPFSDIAADIDAPMYVDFQSPEFRENIDDDWFERQTKKGSEVVANALTYNENNENAAPTFTQNDDSESVHIVPDSQLATYTSTPSNQHLQPQPAMINTNALSPLILNGSGSPSLSMPGSGDSSNYISRVTDLLNMTTICSRELAPTPASVREHSPAPGSTRGSTPTCEPALARESSPQPASTCESAPPPAAERQLVTLPSPVHESVPAPSPARTSVLAPTRPPVVGPPRLPARAPARTSVLAPARLAALPPARAPMRALAPALARATARVPAHVPANVPARAPIHAPPARAPSPTPVGARTGIPNAIEQRLAKRRSTSREQLAHNTSNYGGGDTTIGGSRPSSRTEFGHADCASCLAKAASANDSSMIDVKPALNRLARPSALPPRVPLRAPNTNVKPAFPSQIPRLPTKASAPHFTYVPRAERRAAAQTAAAVVNVAPVHAHKHVPAASSTS